MLGSTPSRPCRFKDSRSRRIGAGLLFSTGLSLLLLPIAPAMAEPPANVNWNRQEQEIYDYDPTGSQDRGIIDAANPFDLMNRLRRATAMGDATSPDDAIDEALREFEAQQSSGSSIQGP